MPKFSVKKQEKKAVRTVTFNQESDYKAVFLLVKGEPESKPRLIHVVQAEKLIAEGKAVAAKGVSVNEENTVVTTKKIDKK